MLRVHRDKKQKDKIGSNKKLLMRPVENIKNSKIVLWALIYQNQNIKNIKSNINFNEPFPVVPRFPWAADI